MLHNNQNFLLILSTVIFVVVVRFYEMVCSSGQAVRELII